MSDATDTRPPAGGQDPQFTKAGTPRQRRPGAGRKPKPEPRVRLTARVAVPTKDMAEAKAAAAGMEMGDWLTRIIHGA